MTNDINLALQYKIKEKHIMKWSFFHSQDFYTQRVVLNEIKQNLTNYYQEDNKLKWYNITSSFGFESKLKNNLSVLNQFNSTNYNVQYNYNLYQKYTSLYDVYINNSVANALQNLSQKYYRPFIFGVLTPNTEQQALDRAGGKYGNKGVEAAITALKMASLMRQ